MNSCKLRVVIHSLECKDKSVGKYKWSLGKTRRNSTRDSPVLA